MSWQEDFRNLLNAQLAQRRASNSKYSMRTFAKDLKISVGGLSGLLNQRLNISADRAGKLVAKLTMDAADRERLLAKMGQPILRATEPLGDQHSEVLTNWLYFATLHFFELDKPSDKSAAAIAKRLAVSTAEIEEVIESLVRREFLERLPSGELIKKGVNWHAGDGPPSQVIRQHHLSNLQVAAKALEQIPASERDFSTVTFCGNAEFLNLARKEIRALSDRISALMVAAPVRDEVYRLSVSLFPLNFEARE